MPSARLFRLGGDTGLSWCYATHISNCRCQANRPNQRSGFSAIVVLALGVTFSTVSCECSGGLRPGSPYGATLAQIAGGSYQPMLRCHKRGRKTPMARRERRLHCVGACCTCYLWRTESALGLNGAKKAEGAASRSTPGRLLPGPSDRKSRGMEAHAPAGHKRQYGRSRWR